VSWAAQAVVDPCDAAAAAAQTAGNTPGTVAGPFLSEVQTYEASSAHGATSTCSFTAATVLAEAKVFAHDATGGDHLGTAVALSGDGKTMLVGAPDDDDRLLEASGSGYIFTREYTAWRRGAKLVPPLGVHQAGAFAGYAVALSGDALTAALGAYGAFSEAGAVFVFEAATGDPGGAWSYAALLRPSAAGDLVAGARFAWSTALNGDGSVLLCGAPGAPDADAQAGGGAAFAFRRDGATWSGAAPADETKLAATAAAGSAAGDAAGRSVALSTDGAVAAVGAPLAHSPESDAGAAYVVAWSTDSELSVTNHREPPDKPPRATRQTTENNYSTQNKTGACRCAPIR